MLAFFQTYLLTWIWVRSLTYSSMFVSLRRVIYRRRTCHITSIREVATLCRGGSKLSRHPDKPTLGVRR